MSIPNKMLSFGILLAALAPALPAQQTAPAFDSQEAPPVPDYRNPASWAARPDAPGASTAVPPGASKALKRKDVDVFYIHPTTYRTPDRWNQDIANNSVNDWTDTSVIRRQAALFNGCCRIYAPRYRQASFLATKDRLMQGDGGKAYALAYSDVERAFDYFIEYENKGRPFIIAGHSQGAEMTMRLLRNRIDGQKVQKRMVAAYVIGLDITEGAFGRTFKSLVPCDRPDQSGCVLAWNAVTTDADLAMLRRFAGTRYAHEYGTDEGRTPLCVNPLTFDRKKPAAIASASKGAVPGGAGEGALKPLVPASVAAECKDGFLVTKADPALGLEPLPGGSLHYHEFGLFYADIRGNVMQRIKAWSRAHRR